MSTLNTVTLAKIGELSNDRSYLVLVNDLEAGLTGQWVHFHYGDLLASEFASVDVTLLSDIELGTVDSSPGSFASGHAQLSTDGQYGIFNILAADTTAWLHDENYWMICKVIDTSANESWSITRIQVMGSPLAGITL